MGLWDAIVRLFDFGDDNNDQPSEEDREGAEATDELTRAGGEGEQYYNEGIDMGTVPITPVSDGADTDPNQNISWIRRWLDW